MTPSQTSSLCRISEIMERASDRASSLAGDEILKVMKEFAKGLKATTILHFYCGMGTYGFIIKRGGKSPLWVTPGDVYYSDRNTSRSLLRDLISPLVETLEFLDKVNADHRIWFSDCTVNGSYSAPRKHR